MWFPYVLVMRQAVLVFLITLILGLLEISLVFYPLLLCWSMAFSLVGKENESLFLSFFSGLWLDFLKGEDWGKTSMAFLIFWLVVALYKRKFKVVHPLYFFPFVGLTVLVYNFYEFGDILVGKLPFSLLLAVGLFKAAEVLTPKEKEIKVEA